MNHKQIVFRMTTIAAVLVFAGSGVGNLIHHEHIAADMKVMGYPTYFMTILGMWKVAGALTIAVPGVPRLKEWAYAGMLIDLTSAMISRGVSGFGIEHVIPPLVVCALVLTSWALRPASRRLPNSHEMPRGVRFRTAAVL